MKYLISKVSRRGGNCQISAYKLLIAVYTKKSGALKKLIHHFQYFHYYNIDIPYITNFMKKIRSFS